MAVFVCLVLELLLWTRAGGSSSQPRFVKTNGNLLMTVTEEVQIGDDIFLWRFNNSNNILIVIGNSPTIYDDYTDRVEFFHQNLSLKLNNVQLRDSGIYTAVVSGIKDKILATYVVTVEAPVSPVLLRVDSVSISSESCNFTVSCTTERSSISRSFTCDRLTCEEPRPPTPGPAPSLHLHLSNVSIICNHSNHVSWRNHTKDIQHVCRLLGAKDPQVSGSEVSWCEVKTVVFSVGLLLMVSALITVHVLECIRKKNI